MKLIKHNQTLAGQELTTVTHEGREHWILPVIMMVEGVHHGSGGPLLYTTQELGQFPVAWNGTPVVIGHPDDKEGNPTPANTPEISSQIIGRLYNTRMEGNKLKSEAWIDIAHLQELSEETYNYIVDQRALEVSIGVFSEELNISGEFNNEEYRAIAQNLRPDHLALLPGEIGACSWDDGCGVRVNHKKEANEEMKNLKEMSNKELFKQGIGTHLISNETGFRDIMQNIQGKLDQMDNDLRVHYLEELFDNNFIYRIHNRESGEVSFYRRSYTVQEDGSIEFSTDPVQVRKDVSFVEMESGKIKRTKFNSNIKPETSMSENTSPCKIDALIANEATQYTEKDKEWLSTFSDEQLDRITPKEIKPVAEVIENKEVPKKEDAPKTNASDENGPVKIDKEVLKENVKAILNEASDPETFINDFMPEGLRGEMKSGLKMYHEKREALIKGIVANSKFEATHLEKWVDADLQNLHDSVVPAGDYSAQGEGVATNQSPEGGNGMEHMLGLPKKEDKS